MNRKDDHIRYALEQPQKESPFSVIRLSYEALPLFNVSDIKTDVSIFGQTFPYPIFINAMTGGSENAKKINERLAMLANAFNLPMALGSASTLFENPEMVETFSIVKKVNPEGFLIANLGAHHPIENVEKVIQILQPNAFEYHLNVAQELAMPEGDRHFTSWSKNIQEAAKTLKIPFIVKEVGFGMNEHTMKRLHQWGVQYVNVGGRGGTNFAWIENQRRTVPLQGLNEVGYSTPESLLRGKAITPLTLIASGGIQTPMEVVKSLVLGAKIVGMSRYFLRLVTEKSHEDAVALLQTFIEEIKAIMVTLNVNTIDKLPEVDYHIEGGLWIR